MTTMSLTQRFIPLIDECYRTLKPGHTLTVLYNGINTLTVWHNDDVAGRSENVSSHVAKEIENHLQLLDFQIKKFRISPCAFEALARKPRVHWR